MKDHPQHTAFLNAPKSERIFRQIDSLTSLFNSEVCVLHTRINPSQSLLRNLRVVHKRDAVTLHLSLPTFTETFVGKLRKTTESCNYVVPGTVALGVRVSGNLI